jgi:hypothetical protein
VFCTPECERSQDLGDRSQCDHSQALGDYSQCDRSQALGDRSQCDLHKCNCDRSQVQNDANLSLLARFPMELLHLTLKH